MSKNLRGYSGTQVQINLDEITASSVTATNGNFTTLTIGTYAITTLNVSDLVASGVVKFTGITQQNPLNTDDHNILIHDPTTNRLYKFNSLQFSPINNQLSIHNLLSSGEIYYKNQTLDQRFEPLGGGGGSYVTTNTAQTISGIKTFQNKQEFDEIETTGDVDIGGNVSVNGNVSVTSLPQDNTDNNFRYITFQGVGNVLHGDSKLTFNPSTNTLSIVFLDVQDINATGIISGTFNIIAENKTDSTNYPISFHDTSTNRLSIGDASYLSSFTYNPSTRTMFLENGQITNATISIANITDLNVTANSRSDDVEYKVVLLRSTDDRICEDSSNNITYNPFNQRLTVVKTTTTNLNIGQLLTTNNNTFYSCMFQGNNNDISQAPPLANFHYNPSELKLKIDNVEVTNDLTVTDDLTVTGRTDLGTIVSINNLNTTVINTTYRVLLWDNTSSSSKTIRSDSNVYYDTTTNTLYSPNISGNITAQIRSGSTDYPVLFYDTATNEICIDSSATNITYNPSDNLLDVRNMNVVVNLTTEKVTLDTGSIFNEGNNTYMGLKAISNNGTDLSALDYGIALWQDGHIRMWARNNIRFRIYNSTLAVTTERLLISDSNVNVKTNLLVNNSATITGTTTVTAFNATADLNNRILFLSSNTETGDISNHSNLFYNPSNETLRSTNITAVTNLNSPTVTVTGTNNGQLTIDPTYGLFYNHADGHIFRISGTWKLRIDTTLTTIYTDLLLDTGILKTGNTGVPIKLQVGGNDKVVIEDTKTCIKNALCVETCTVPSASTRFPVLLLNEGTNEIKKADTFMSYDPSLDRIFGKDIMLNEDSGTRGRLTLVEPIRYGGNLVYTPLNYTYIIGNTDTIATLDPVGSGLNSGKFGNGVYMGILRSGIKATAFGANGDLWTWNAYISATNTATQFTCSSLITGTWEITVTCDYTSSGSSGSNRVNPIMRLELNGTEIEEGTQSLYIRHQLGRVGTMRTNYILKLTTGDDIMLKTYVNYGSITNYTSSIASADFTLSNFIFRATFLGPLDEYDRTPS